MGGTPKDRELRSHPDVALDHSRFVSHSFCAAT